MFSFHVDQITEQGFRTLCGGVCVWQEGHPKQTSSIRLGASSWGIMGIIRVCETPRSFASRSFWSLIDGSWKKHASAASKKNTDTADGLAQHAQWPSQ